MCIYLKYLEILASERVNLYLTGTAVENGSWLGMVTADWLFYTAKLRWYNQPYGNAHSELLVVLVNRWAIVSTANIPHSLVSPTHSQSVYCFVSPVCAGGGGGAGRGRRRAPDSRRRR